MAYSGRWRSRAVVYADENTAPLGAADPARHLEVWDAASHGVDDTAETRSMPGTPYRLDYAPPTLTDSTDSATVPAVKTDVPNDVEPRDHGLSTATRPTDGGPCPIHMRDLGSMWAREYEVPTREQHDQVYTTSRFTPNVGTSFSRTALIRGANAYPENNPPDTVQHTAGLPPAAESARVGWTGEPRPGLRVQRWSERRIPMHRWRGDVRPLRTNTAKSASDAPALDTGNQYRTPFSDLVAPRVKTLSRPMQRRDPRPWDVAEVEDGTETAGTESLMSWGL